MDDKGIRTGDVLNGKWVVAELTSPAAYGVLHIDTFIVRGRPKRNDKGVMMYHLIAGDLLFTSAEGWTARVWEKDKSRVGTDKKEIYTDLLEQGIHSLLMIPIEDIPDDVKKQIKRVAYCKPFSFKQKEIIIFMSRRDNPIIEYLEKQKITDLLDTPEHAFKEGNIPELMRKIKEKWKRPNA